MNPKLKQALEEGKCIADEVRRECQKLLLYQEEERRLKQIKFEQEIEQLKEWIEQDIYLKIARAVGRGEKTVKYTNSFLVEREIPEPYTFEQLALAINKIPNLCAKYSMIPEDYEGPKSEWVTVEWYE